jgi:ABC-type glycerol-3-phosphate transport system substrate-binding protein
MDTRATDHRTGTTRRALVLAAGSSGVLAACAPATQAPRENFRAAGSQLTLTMIQQPRPATREVMLAMLAEFSAEFPRLKVDVVDSSEVHVVQKALQLHVAGSSADVVNWARDGYDLRDSIVDVKPFMARDKLNASIYVPTVAEILGRDGKFMGVPCSVSCDALIYNPAALQAVGLPLPPVNPDDKSWTMEKFQEYAIKLTQRPDRFGWAGSFSGGFGFMDAATYFGVGPYDPKTNKVLVNTPEFKRGLQYWVDLRLRYQTAPDAEELRGIPNGFASGRIAMNSGFSLPAGPQFTPRLATLPYSGPGKNISARMSPSVLFAGNTKQIEGTWEFLRWTTEPKRGATLAKTLGHVVTAVLKAQEIRTKEFIQESGVDPTAWALQSQGSKFVGWGMYKYPQVEIVSRNEINPRFQNELLTGKISVNDFSIFAEQQLNGAIAQGM